MLGYASLMIRNLQALRFLAAAAVLLYHGADSYTGLGGSLPIRPVVSVGSAGVDIFFVISGFIIWWTTKDLSGPTDAGHFAYRRALRIYLTFWLVFGAYAFFLLAVEPRSLPPAPAVLINFLLLPQPIVDRLLGLSWTLTYELYFYSLAVVAVALGGRRYLLPIGAIITAVALAASQWLPPATGRLLTTPFLAEFLAGAAVAHLSERARIPWPWVWAALAIGGFAAAAVLNNRVFAGELNNGLYPVYRVAIFLPISAAFVAAAIGLEGRLIPPRWMVALGDASYAIYLWHIPIFVAWRRLMADGGLPPGLHELSWCAVVVFVCLLSVATTRWIEQPIRRRMRRTRVSAASQRDGSQTLAEPRYLRHGAHG